MAVGIILLFIGVAVQPAFANEVSTTTSSDTEDECDICPKASKSHLVLIKSLINRVEKYDNQLSVSSKLNLEIGEKYKELSDRISSIIEIDNGLNTNGDYPIICNILFLLIYGKLMQLIFISVFFQFLSEQPSKLLSKIFYPLLNLWTLLYYNQVMILISIYHEFNCPPPFYPNTHEFYIG